MNPKITSTPEGASERQDPVATVSPQTMRRIQENRSRFRSAGWTEGCSCGRVHSRFIDPKTGETYVSTGWY